MEPRITRSKSKTAKVSAQDDTPVAKKQGPKRKDSSIRTPKSKKTKNPKMNKPTTQEEAARMIQRFYRRCKMRERLRALAWKAIWNELDINEEKEVMAQEEQLNKYFIKLRARKAKYIAKARALEEQVQEKLGKKKFKDKFFVDSSYHGPHITTEFQSQSDSLSQSQSLHLSASALISPSITLEFIVEMIDYFKRGMSLHYKYAHQIITDAIQVLQEASTVEDIAIPSGGKLTVCGDIHGQLNDLLTIFEQNGLPASTNVYLFNGDFVDRGDFGMEVLLILYGFKVLYPRAMYLNRGNHEQQTLNERYGFADEVREKYDADMYDLVSSREHMTNEKMTADWMDCQEQAKQLTSS